MSVTVLASAPPAPQRAPGSGGGQASGSTGGFDEALSAATEANRPARPSDEARPSGTNRAEQAGDTSTTTPARDHGQPVDQVPADATDIPQEVDGMQRPADVTPPIPVDPTPEASDTIEGEKPTGAPGDQWAESSMVPGTIDTAEHAPMPVTSGAPNENAHAPGVGGKETQPVTTLTAQAVTTAASPTAAPSASANPDQTAQAITATAVTAAPATPNAPAGTPTGEGRPEVTTTKAGAPQSGHGTQAPNPTEALASPPQSLRIVRDGQTAGANTVGTRGTDAVTTTAPRNDATPTALPTTPQVATPTAPAPSLPAAAPTSDVGQQLVDQLRGPLIHLKQAAPGEHSFSVRVTPENLGPVSIRAIVSGDTVRIEITCVNDTARDAIRPLMNDLKRDLQGAGLSTDLNLGHGRQSGHSDTGHTPTGPWRGTTTPRGPGVATPDPLPAPTPDTTATTGVDVIT